MIADDFMKDARDNQLDRAAAASYHACVVGQREMMPLPPELEPYIPHWDELEEPCKDHWRAVVRAAFDA